jgi:hypothetical protein
MVDLSTMKDDEEVTKRYEAEHGGMGVLLLAATVRRIPIYGFYLAKCKFSQIIQLTRLNRAEPVKLRQQLSNKKLARFNWKIWIPSGTWWSLEQSF